MDVIDMCKLAKKASRKMAGFSSKAKNDSRVLSAINLDREYIDGTIRISFGYFNNFEEIEYAVENIKKSVDEIRDIMK